MARKISRETSLDLAITLFWDHGFRGTSMEMLTAALGVEKPSIYSNFGSKKELYLEALSQYRTMLMERVSRDLQSGTRAREGLDRLISNLLAPSNAAIRRGCLATNSALEMADLDADVRALVKTTFADLLATLTQAIRRGQQEGDIRDDRSAASLAQFVASCFGGARVLEKSSIDTSHWAETGRLILSVLDPPKTSRRSAGAGSTSRGSSRAKSVGRPQKRSQG